MDASPTALRPFAGRLLGRLPEDPVAGLGARALADHWVSDNPGDIKNAASHMTCDSAAEVMADELGEECPSRGVGMAARRLCDALKAEAHAFDQPQPQALGSSPSSAGEQPSQAGQLAPAASLQGAPMQVDQQLPATPATPQPLSAQSIPVPALKSSKCPVSTVVGVHAEAAIKHGFVWSDRYANRLRKNGKQGVKGGLVKDTVHGEATEKGQQVFLNVQHGVMHSGQLDLALRWYPSLQGIGERMPNKPGNAAYLVLRSLVMKRMRNIPAKQAQKQKQASCR